MIFGFIDLDYLETEVKNACFLIFAQSPESPLWVGSGS
jgi:hypothetical protein